MVYIYVYIKNADVCVSCPSYHYKYTYAPHTHTHAYPHTHTYTYAPTHIRIYLSLSWQSIGENLDEGISRMILGVKSRFLPRISRLVRHWLPFEREVARYTRRLRLYELQRKEPLYNPRWPPPRRGLLLANTKQEAPPWLTARDGMIYWDFCLFAPALAATNTACLARYLDVGR